MKRNLAIIDYLETRLAEANDEIRDLNENAGHNVTAYLELLKGAANLECLANNKKLANQFKAEAQSATSMTIALKARLVSAESEVTRLAPYEGLMLNWKDRAISAEAKLDSADKRLAVHTDNTLRLSSKIEEQKKALIRLEGIIDKLNGDAYILRGQIRRAGLEPDVPETSMS